MDQLMEILKVAVPALIIGAVLIYLFHEGTRFIKERDKRPKPRPQIQTQAGVAVAGHSDTVLKLQLQAAERFALYLERIAPDRLVMRIHRAGMDAKMLQSEMLRSIREEFDHNLSQQIYISEESWNLIKRSKDEMIKFITQMGEQLPDGESAMALTRKIFEGASKVERLPSDIALQYLRAEIRQIMNA